MIRETTRPGLGQNSCTCLAGKSLIVLASFPGGSDSKVSACSAGDPGLIPGSGRSPGEGNGSPLQYSRLENPHGQRSLVGYNSWGHTIGHY